jgi:hypothetical protein
MVIADGLLKCTQSAGYRGLSGLAWLAAMVFRYAKGDRPRLTAKDLPIPLDDKSATVPLALNLGI